MKSKQRSLATLRRDLKSRSLLNPLLDEDRSLRVVGDWWRRAVEGDGPGEQWEGDIGGSSGRE